MAKVKKINVDGTTYDISHEGELKNSGFEVVTELPTTGLFAGREVFHDRNLQPYMWNGHNWITNYKTYKIVSGASISQQGWYDIGYYTDTTTQGSYEFWSTDFHGTLRIITGYNLDRPLSLVLSISGGFTQLCMTQLSSCIGYGIIPKIRVVHNSELKRRILQFYYSANRRNSISINYTDNSYYPSKFFMPLYAKSDVNYEGDAIIKEFTLTNGVKTNYNVEGASIIKTGGTATQMLMADGSTKDISEFATVATSGSYNDLTDKPTLYEANLAWGGRNIYTGYSPIDAGMVGELSANLMAFPNPAGITVEYSRDGGVTWLDYEAIDAQKINFFTSYSQLYCGKSGPDGLAANVDYMLRITINPMECGLYAELNKAIMRISTDNSLGCWCTLSALTQTDYNLGNISDDYYKVFVNKAVIGGWPEYNVLNFSKLATSNTTADSTKKHRLVRFTFGYDYVSSNPAPGYNGLRIFSIKLFGLGRYTMPSNLAWNNHLYRYDSLQNAFFPAKVESKEIINFDVNNIEPTQTGSSVSKTSTWLWQYLVQGVNWLKANKFSGSYNDLTDKPALFSGSYNDLTDKPTLATVATSGSYNDLTDKPTFSGSYNDLTDKPTLFSGSYDDLTDKPNLATVATSGSYNDLTDKPTLATVATSGSYNDLTNKPTQLPNPNPITIKTADGVKVIYDGSASGAVILEAGHNASVTATQDSDDIMTVKFDAVVPQIPTLATVATSGSYDDLLNKPTLATVATSGSYNDLTNKPTQLPNPNALNITVLDSEGALLGLSMVYDGVAAKYLKLTEGYGIQLSNTNLNNSHEVTINLKRIAGTTLLGNANGTTDIPQAITMEQLRTMLGSLTLNSIDVTLGGNSSYTLPCYISVGGTLYHARIENNWLQIYRNGVWANIRYLLTLPPTGCTHISDLSAPSWYNESVTEYELDDSATEQLLKADSSTNIANWIKEIGAQQITFNSSVIPSKQFNKGALDNVISNLKGNGYSVFVDNDIDTILSSGNDWVTSIKIKRFRNLSNAIIECYVAR